MVALLAGRTPPLSATQSASRVLERYGYVTGRVRDYVTTRRFCQVAMTVGPPPVIRVAARCHRQAVHPSVGLMTSRSLRVVMVASLREALHKTSEQAVLTALAHGDSMLVTVNSRDVRCALVSYRQERCTRHSTSGAIGRRSGDDSFADFTLDGAALRSLLEQAHMHKIDALWTDIWCYRSGGAAYDHKDFCRTLHSVTEGIIAVLWLPRSKVGSRGEYAYRLWCTFEASCVRQRELPVVICGIGLSSFQRSVRRFGSFTPSFHSDGTLYHLCRLNLFFYLCEVTMLADAICVFIYTTEDDAGFAVMAFVLFLNPVFWLAFRAMMGQELRLARNAKKVLRTMSAACSRAVCDFTDAPTTSMLTRKSSFVVGQQGSGGWLADLPWLPAFDHRDALVVLDLLSLSRPDLALTKEAVSAVAFSAHTAACLQISPGDKSARELSMVAWLGEHDISLDAPTGALPLDELRKLGWVSAPGLTSALVAPLGELAVAPPASGQWSAINAKALRSKTIGFAAWFFFFPSSNVRARGQLCVCRESIRFWRISMDPPLAERDVCARRQWSRISRLVFGPGVFEQQTGAASNHYFQSAIRQPPRNNLHRYRVLFLVLVCE